MNKSIGVIMYRQTSTLKSTKMIWNKKWLSKILLTLQISLTKRVVESSRRKRKVLVNSNHKVIWFTMIKICLCLSNRRRKIVQYKTLKNRILRLKLLFDKLQVIEIIFHRRFSKVKSFWLQKRWKYSKLKNSSWCS